MKERKRHIFSVWYWLVREDYIMAQYYVVAETREEALDRFREKKGKEPKVIDIIG